MPSPVTPPPAATTIDTVIKPAPPLAATVSAPVVADETYDDLRVGNVYPVRGFYFAFNQTAISSGDIKQLDDAFELLQKNPAVKIQIRAYADCRGTYAVNKRISAKRALAYKKYLEYKGIAPRRLSCIGLAGENPAVACLPCNTCTEEQRQKNRRIEFKILEK